MSPFEGEEPNGDTERRSQPEDGGARSAVDYGALFAASPDAYLVLAPDLRIVAANRPYSRATMIEEHDIVGRHLFDVFPDNPDDANADGVSNLRASLERVIGTGNADTMARQKYDIRRPAELGGHFEVRYWSPLNTPVFGDDGALRYIIHRVEDVTSTVAIEQQESEQRRLAGELRAEVQDRSEELERANELLRRANAAKNEFLSRISHELRTPLNAILGFGQLLQMDNLGADHRSSVDQIIKAGEHLLELIDEVLDISRVESGSLRMSMEPVGLREVVTDAMAMIRPMASGRSITLRDELPAGSDTHVVADRQRLRQILVNLLTNAVKYNRERGSVTVAQQFLDGKVRISVADTGIGIPVHGLPRLFQPFERLGADETAVQGTGLGLTLTKHLVEAMEGEIGVTSQYGTGTTFWVDFAVAEPQLIDSDGVSAGLAAAPPNAAALTRKTVLYVEDNLSNVRLVERVMERRPEVDLIVAMQGRLAVDLALEHQPSLVLLDLHLPDIGGEEVLRMLRAEPRTASIPVVILSADATPANIRELQERGADDYLTKPFDIPRLLALVDNNGAAPGAAGGDDESAQSLDRNTLTVLRNVLGRSGNGLASLRELVDMFSVDIAEHLSGLREAVLAGDAARVEYLAHRLAGSSGNLGARIVARVCRELETMGHNRDLVSAPGCLHRLEEACASAEAALRAEFASSNRL